MRKEIEWSSNTEAQQGLEDAISTPLRIIPKQEAQGNREDFHPGRS